jgi:hypothetical protein
MNKYLGVCGQCKLPCNHTFVSHLDMNELTNTAINNLEKGCKHFQGLEICETCRTEMISHVWRLAGGESVETV